MVTIPELKEKYEGLDMQLPAKSEETIDPDCLLTFEYEYPERDTEVVIDTDEFTAVCPWTGSARHRRAGHQLRPPREAASS